MEHSTYEILKINIRTKEELNFIIKAAQHDDVLISYHYITQYEEYTKLLTDKLPTLSVLIPHSNTSLMTGFRKQIEEYADDSYEIPEETISELNSKKPDIIADLKIIEQISNALDTILLHYIRK